MTGIITITPAYPEYVFRTADIEAMFDPEDIAITVTDITNNVATFEVGYTSEALNTLIAIEDHITDSVMASPLVSAVAWTSTFE